MKKYLTLLAFSQNPASDGFKQEMDEILNEQAKSGCVLKQVLQVRANYFLMIFERITL